MFLFLVVATTDVNTMGERGVFDASRAWWPGRGLSLRALFWVTGALAFVISPFAVMEKPRLEAGALLVGVLSALADNVPVMFAVLSMNPAMSEGQ